MAKIYVASAFANKDEVRQVQAYLTAAGHEITHDWTVEDASHLTPRSREWWSFLFDCGAHDLIGIENADAVVVIAHPEMRDTRFEMGYAIGSGCPVFLLNADRAVSVFYDLCSPASSVADLLMQLRDLELRERRGAADAA